MAENMDNKESEKSAEKDAGGRKEEEGKPSPKRAGEKRSHPSSSSNSGSSTGSSSFTSTNSSSGSRSSPAKRRRVTPPKRSGASNRERSRHSPSRSPPSRRRSPPPRRRSPSRSPSQLPRGFGGRRQHPSPPRRRDARSPPRGRGGTAGRSPPRSKPSRRSRSPRSPPTKRRHTERSPEPPKRRRAERESSPLKQKQRSPEPPKREQRSPEPPKQQQRSPEPPKREHPLESPKQLQLLPPQEAEPKKIEEVVGEKRRLLVKNLSRVVNEGHLKEIFGDVFGVSVKVGLDLGKPHPREAFVDYEKVEDAEKAAHHFNGGHIDNRLVECEVANIPDPSSREQAPQPQKHPLITAGEGRTSPQRDERRRQHDSPQRYRNRSPSRGERQGLPRASGANLMPLGRGGGVDGRRRGDRSPPPRR